MNSRSWEGRRSLSYRAGLRTTVEYMEAQWSGGEVGSGRGHYCHWIGLIGGRGETRSYEIVSPPKLRGSRTLLVSVSVLVLEVRK